MLIHRYNPKWKDHSRNVARAAERIASECNMDSEKAYIMGLLHDIGRRFGKMTIKHGLKGYHFLNELNLPEYAQISLTHSYTIQIMTDLFNYVTFLELRKVFAQ